MLKLSKVRPAAQGVGRGSDNEYLSATWNVLSPIDGEPFARVHAESQRQYEPADWHVDSLDGISIRVGFRTRQQAIDWVVARISTPKR